LLRVVPLGARRSEADADLQELFRLRARTQGLAYARRRYYVDVLSLWSASLMPSPHAEPSRRIDPIRDVLQDLTYAFRLFRRSPATVSVTVVGLAMAIAVSTAVFTVMNSAVFQSSGVVEPATAVRIFRAHDGGYSTAWPYAEFESLKGAARGVTIEASLPEKLPLVPPGDSAPGPMAQVTFVSGGFLEALAGRAAMGRLLTTDDDRPGAAPVLVASHGFWTRQLGGDRAIVGRRIPWNGVEFTVVGVTSRSFRGPSDGPPDFWAPLAAYHAALGGEPLDRTASVGLSVFGRIHAGVERSAAEGILNGIAASFAATAGQVASPRVRFEAADGRPSSPTQKQMAVVVTATVFTVIALVLVVACVNVANLLLASAAARRGEVGLRVALGAGRARVARQLLTESVALGLIAGGLALGLTLWLMPILLRVLEAPAFIDTAPDARVYMFLAIVSIGAGLGAGFTPARHVLGENLVSPLKSGSGYGGVFTPSRLRSTLIGVQAAVSLVLLVVAALLTRGVVRATQVELGFDADRLLSVAPSFPRGGYDEAGAQAYWDLALERVRALPGVRAASLASHPPFGSGNSVTVLRRGSQRYAILHHEVKSEHFATIGLRVVRGRIFTADEIMGRAPVAVISESLARDFLPHQDPIGLSLDRVGVDGATSVEIIGVVSDAITARLRELGTAAIYRPMRDTREAKMMVRADSPGAIVPSLRAAVQPIDPRIRLDVKTVNEGLRRQLSEPRALASIAGTLALLALMLAVVGIYGVTAFVVGQRTQEIGVRVALGATASHVRTLLVRESLRPVALGLAGGALAALFGARVLAGVLYGIGPADPIAFAFAFGVLLSVAWIAVLLPTRRAARVDPAAVLRQL
jgi:predicted permease